MADETTGKAGKVKFKLGVRLSHKFEDGKVSHLEKGSTININPRVADKYQKMGLGEVLGRSAALEVKAS